MHFWGSRGGRMLTAGRPPEPHDARILCFYLTPDLRGRG
jgi:hypothetical protein